MPWNLHAGMRSSILNDAYHQCSRCGNASRCFVETGQLIPTVNRKAKSENYATTESILGTVGMVTDLVLHYVRKWLFRVLRAQMFLWRTASLQTGMLKLKSEAQCLQPTVKGSGGNQADKMLAAAPEPGLGLCASLSFSCLLGTFHNKKQ